MTQSKPGPSSTSAVSADVERLRLFAEEFEKETGLSLPYHGEDLPRLMKHLVDEHLYWRRPCIPKELHEELRQRQDDKCYKCDDKLDGKGEAHREVAVAEGGTALQLRVLAYVSRTDL